jgi:hypothetical protein
MSLCEVPVTLIKFLRTFKLPEIFSKKAKNIKFHENPCYGSRVVQCGQTDGHHEANNRFSQFCESA